MARFDVYRIQGVAGYFLDVQADFLSHLDTRVVIPLLSPEDVHFPARRLNPCFHIGDEEVVMMTEFMAAVQKSALRNVIGNLASQRDEIVMAADFLMQGF
jgi:toxin CcdB